jgi:hypothetical protein
MQSVLIPIVLLIVSGGMLFTVAKSQYGAYKENRDHVAQLDAAIDKFRELDLLKKERVERKSKIAATSLSKLENGMLSDSVDTIRLTMDIQGIAAKHGILIKKIDIKKDEAVSEGLKAAQAQAANSTVGISTGSVSGRKYGVLSIGFTLNSTYAEFKEFLYDLERSLRVIDLMSLKISSGSKEEVSTGATATKKTTGVYNYSVQAQTYWLK